MMSVLTTAALIIIGVLLFELIIFFHEGGHFLAAKKSGVKVNEFALGMGPKLFSFTKGETTYSLRAFPIGGFCSMEGEDEESDNPRAFNNAKIWKRMIIIVAGAFMNILLGLLIVLVERAVVIYHQILAVVRHHRLDLGQLKNGERSLILHAFEHLVRGRVFGIAVLINLNRRLLLALLGELSASVRVATGAFWPIPIQPAAMTENIAAARMAAKSFFIGICPFRKEK